VNDRDPSLTALRAPPHSIEAEQTVLGSLLIANDAFDAVSDVLTGRDFYAHQHRVIWDGMHELLAAGKPLDQVTLAARLEECRTLEHAGGREYIGNLVLNTPSARNVKRYAGIVRERSILRSIAGAAMQMQDLAINPTTRPASELLAEAQDLLAALESQQPTDEVQPIGRYLPAFSDVLEQRKGRRGLQGLSTGLHDLDWMTNGLQKGDMIVIAGRPSMGKSALSMQLAQFSALNEKSVAVFSLEMSREQLIERMIANVGEVDGGKMRSGDIDAVDWQNISGAFCRLHDARLFVDDVSGLTVPKLRTKARRIQRKYGLDLVVVDYLGLMEGDGDNRYAQVTDISRRIKLLARELNVPLVVLAQLNRQGQQRTNNRPQMSDLRDSGAIEQDSDVIILMHREDYYDEESPRKGTAEAIIAKQRMGRTGTVNLAFEGEFSRFRSLPRGWKPPEAEPAQKKSRVA
jgi:replicative DNA helicase